MKNESISNDLTSIPSFVTKNISEFNSDSDYILLGEKLSTSDLDSRLSSDYNYIYAIDLSYLNQAISSIDYSEYLIELINEIDKNINDSDWGFSLSLVSSESDTVKLNTVNLTGPNINLKEIPIHNKLSLNDSGDKVILGDQVIIVRIGDYLSGITLSNLIDNVSITDDTGIIIDLEYELNTIDYEGYTKLTNLIDSIYE